MQNVSLLAGCDMVVSGFAQIQAQLQYRASGCSIGLPVVVGTSRGGGGGGGGGGGNNCYPVGLPLVGREWKNGSNSSYNCTPFLHSLLTKGR